MSTLDGSKIRNYSSYDELVESVVQTTHDSGVFVKLTHIETVIHNMVRSIDDVTKRPDFKQLDVKYSLNTITNSILKKDVYTSLIFQGLKRQFTDHNSFRKTGVGVFDDFFNISKEYRTI